MQSMLPCTNEAKIKSIKLMNTKSGKLDADLKMGNGRKFKVERTFGVNIA